MSLRSTIVGQFKRPRGLLGNLAGQVMAHRPSNIERNLWTVGLLNLQPDDRVLEIGCGPGVALLECAGKITGGRIVGIDHSQEMIQQAARRLEKSRYREFVELRVADAMQLEDLEQFDRVFSLNVVQFFPDMQAAFKIIWRLLAAKGRVFTTYQPRSKNPTLCEAYAMAERLDESLTSLGFDQVRRHELALRPVPAICVEGRKP